MVIGMIVQAVTSNKQPQGEPPGGIIGNSSGSSSVPAHVNSSSVGTTTATSTTSTTSPIPKSPSYHSHLDQAGGKEFSFNKAHLEASVRIPTLAQDTLVDYEPVNRNPFTNMGSPLRPRDRNAYKPPPGNVQNLPLLKGGLLI